MIDVQPLATLMEQYFRAIDTKQWSELRAILTDDMTMAAPDDVADAPPLGGADRVVRVIERVLGPAVSMHRGVLSNAELTGPGEVRAVWTMEDVVDYPDAPDQSFRGTGSYEVTYRHTPTGWRIGALVLRRTRLDRGA
jgi:hypothetical protein